MMNSKGVAVVAGGDAAVQGTSGRTTTSHFTSRSSSTATTTTQPSNHQDYNCDEDLSNHHLERFDADTTTTSRQNTNSRNRKNPREVLMSNRLRTLEFTLNKLQFAKLGRLYGREEECRQLQDAWNEVRLTARLFSSCRQSLSGVFHRTSFCSSLLSSSSNTTAVTSGTTIPQREALQKKHSAVRRLVVIRGASGTGKSALVETLRQSVMAERGFFLKGKFSQQQRLSRHEMEPYSAFAQACQQLCEIVTSLEQHHHPGGVDGVSSGGGSGGGCGDGKHPFHSQNYYKFTFSQFQEQLNREIGPDASVLTRFIPCLSKLFETDELPDESSSSSSSSEPIEYREGRAQFKFAFRRFNRVIASFGPVVWVLDDIQWADAGSMHLLESLMSDRGMASLLILACYRDDKIYSHMPHLTSIDTIRNSMAQDSCLKVDLISIGNLDVSKINELLIDLLSSSSESGTEALAECVHKKTLGNIFFVIQFLKMLQDMKLLVYNFGLMKWTWDLIAIYSSTAVTDNVVNLIKNKMKRLPASFGRFLPILACLGATLSLSVFELVFDHFIALWNEDQLENVVIVRAEDQSEHEDEQNATLMMKSRAFQFLSRCEQEGLIEMIGDDVDDVVYRWVHDKIQEAAFSLLTSEQELHVLKLEIGHAMLEMLDPPQLDKNLFTVVSLIRTDSPEESPLTRHKPIEVAELYLRAGVKSIERSAFEQATGYLVSGMRLLPTDHWQTHYSLSLELFSTAAEAEYCSGNFDMMRAHCNAVIGQEDRPLLDKRRAYNALIDSTAADHGADEACKLCLSVLSKLGCNFPKNPLTRVVLRGIVKVWFSLKMYMAPVRLSHLPKMEDNAKLWMMTLMDKLLVLVYIIKAEVVPLIVFKGILLTRKKGFGDISPALCAWVGFCLAVFVQDYKEGEKFANQAIELLKRGRFSRKAESKVLFLSHVFILHWLHPVALSIKPLLDSFEVGMAVGDNESAAVCIYYSIEYSFRAGKPLEVLLADCAYFSDQLREINQLRILTIVCLLWQCMLHLTGDNAFTGTLNGERFDREDAERDKYLFAKSYRFQKYLELVFGKYELSYSSIRKTYKDRYCSYRKIHPALLGDCNVFAYDGLSMMSLYHKTRATKYLKLAKSFASKVKRWALAGNPNVTHFDALLDAEMDSVRGNVESAARHYQAAVRFAGRSGLTQDCALAHERYGEHLLRLGPDYNLDAEFHIGEAVKLYSEWGAYAKVQQLQKLQESLFTPSSKALGMVS